MDWIDEFENKLFSTTRANLDIEAAINLKEQHIPTSLYKYRAINCNALKNLENDTIWLADPSTFNDPYDCLHTFQTEKLINFEKINSLKAQVFKDLSDSQRRKYEDAINQVMGDELAEINEYQARVIANSFKLCSFSERLDSTLMWAHYADYHKGFCIEYDFAALPSDDIRKRLLYPVIYRNNLLNATEFYAQALKGQGFNNLFLSLAALVKAEDWKYEHEWRLVFANATMTEAQTYIVPKPKAVYFGARIAQEKKHELKRICDLKAIPTFEMKLDQHRFSLTAQLC